MTNGPRRTSLRIKKSGETWLLTLAYIDLVFAFPIALASPCLRSGLAGCYVFHHTALLLFPLVNLGAATETTAEQLRSIALAHSAQS